METEETAGLTTRRLFVEKSPLQITLFDDYK
jgi:hypothetical protein